ncbi:ankyrin-3-like [Durio zibethinus]|uniref:Ankyrin-3-like n=1 Tax=Durio zibethinus TaxID=66656 RepID=A0A6P5WW21_DURZI|nr:ankyrin-3-like [Durio zibethinus]
MDPKLYKAVMSGDKNPFNELTKLDPSILLKVTISQEDTILHVAAKFKQKELAEEILKLQPSLVYQRNSKGDTPLHIAARLGSEEAVEFFIDFWNKTPSASREVVEGALTEEKLLRMVNLEKETALHEAVKNYHYRVVEMLIKEDPELAEFTNNAGESPLFLAVDRKFVNIAKLILQVDQCSFDGRNNMNALHAAVVRSKSEVRKLFPYLATLILEHPPQAIADLKAYADLNCFMNLFNIPFILINLVWPSRINTAFIKGLLEKHASGILKVDDYGWTPLHYAAFLGKSNILKLFLTYESDDEKPISSPDSIASIGDKEGMTILHVAAKEGRVKILKILAKLCPDIWDIQDNKGRTALHLAVENEETRAVKYILKTKLSDGLVNEQDNEGNTPMHIAAIQGYQSIFELFKWDKRVDKAIANKKGLGVLDMIRLNEDLTLNEKCWMGFSAARRGSLASLECTIDRGQDMHVFKTSKPKHPQKILLPSPTENLELSAKRKTNEDENENENETRRRPMFEKLDNVIDILVK